VSFNPKVADIAQSSAVMENISVM